MKNIQIIFLALVVLSMNTTAMAVDKKQDSEKDTAKKAEDTKCQAPKWAIAIGHEEMWKKHNGCEEKKEDKK